MKFGSVGKPRHIICAAFTYGAHAKEFGVDLKGRGAPMMLLKSPNSLVENNELVVLPDLSKWLRTPEPWGWVTGEVELAVVIGASIHDVRVEEVGRYIQGYTILNDVTQRDLEKAGHSFSIAKSFPTFGPCGPIIVIPEELLDPGDLRLRMKVNGKTVQDAVTSEMNISLFELVSAASKFVALERGDIISTGTPPGCLSYRLQEGDVMEAEIEGIGVLTNRVVAPRRS
jgi:2-keto-4-pentenoate hydratase/2-oxohepta-3-ene-1,7-dioic acid hydratase in catechol pathway